MRPKRVTFEDELLQASKKSRKPHVQPLMSLDIEPPKMLTFNKELYIFSNLSSKPQQQPIKEMDRNSVHDEKLFRELGDNYIPPLPTDLRSKHPNGKGTNSRTEKKNKVAEISAGKIRKFCLIKSTYFVYFHSMQKHLQLHSLTTWHPTQLWLNKSRPSQNRNRRARNNASP